MGNLPSCTKMEEENPRVTPAYFYASHASGSTFNSRGTGPTHASGSTFNSRGTGPNGAFGFDVAESFSTSTNTSASVMFRARSVQPPAKYFPDSRVSSLPRNVRAVTPGGDIVSSGGSEYYSGSGRGTKPGTTEYPPTAATPADYYSRRMGSNGGPPRTYMEAASISDESAQNAREQQQQQLSQYVFPPHAKTPDEYGISNYSRAPSPEMQQLSQTVFQNQVDQSITPVYRPVKESPFAAIRPVSSGASASASAIPPVGLPFRRTPSPATTPVHEGTGTGFFDNTPALSTATTAVPHTTPVPPPRSATTTPNGAPPISLDKFHTPPPPPQMLETTPRPPTPPGAHHARPTPPGSRRPSATSLAETEQFTHNNNDRATPVQMIVASTHAFPIDPRTAHSWKPTITSPLTPNVRFAQDGPLKLRRYPAEESSVYVLPTDFVEQDRLNKQHAILTHVFGGAFRAPVHQMLSNGAKVLDVGCAEGAWMMDVAEKYPNSKFIGIDVSSDSFPDGDQPPNTQFIHANLLERLPFDDNEFDFVFQRLVNFGVPDSQWCSVISELVRVTRPGGWIELLEFDSFQNVGPIFERLEGALTSALRSRGIYTNTGRFLQEHLETHGVLHTASTKNKKSMTNVDSELRTVEMGWPVGGLLGQLNRENVIGLFIGLRPWLATSIGLPVEEYEKVLEEAVKEWETRRTYVVWTSCVGQVTGR
ncbi:hypothetical protein BJ742DRAFT_835653 [Cladochytrium replicatum]|nr:hypothetical protein BJ742DRAFT_835653 [Cladochytrium replicatum]